MVDKPLSIHIEEINNGYLTYCYRDVYDKYKNAVYHPDIVGVIKFIDDTYGEIHRQHLKIKKEKQ